MFGEIKMFIRRDSPDGEQCCSIQKLTTISWTTL